MIHTNHPLNFYIIAFIAGIVMQASSMLFIGILAMVCVVSCYIFLYKNRHTPINNTVIIISSFSFLLGAACYYHTSDNYDQAQKILMTTTTPLTLTIANIDYQENNFYPYQITSQLQDSYSKKLRRHSVIFYTKSLNALTVGDTIVVEQHAFTSPKNASCNDYFKRKGILGTMFVPKIIYVSLQKPYYHFGRWLHAVRERVWLHLKQTLSRDTYALFAPLFGGNKNIHKRNLQPIKKNFKTWGISHYLARSGAHLVFFVWFWAFILKIIPCSPAMRNFLLMIMLIIYTLLTWVSLSFIRALYMALIFYGTKIANRETIGLHTINVVTFFTLFSNPFHLFFIDFQLSFGFSYALIWFSRIHHKKMHVIRHR